MLEELEVLRIVSARLESSGVPFMLTGWASIVMSSLPPNLTWRERRLALARRFYGGELPEAAFKAHAEWEPSAKP
jgi:hypothetical protein